MAGSWKIAAWCAASLAVPGTATAAEQMAAARDCATRITRGNLVVCALAANPDLRVERELEGVLLGRRQTADTLLPSNPVLGLEAARRSTPGTDRAPAFNWSASLSQELELAGQRGQRQRAAQSALQAQRLRLLAQQRDAVGEAWIRYFEVIAARSQQQLALRLLEAARRMAEVVRAKAEQGLIASIDADVANAAALRVQQRALEAERAEAVARARLAFSLGIDPERPPEIAGELLPLEGPPGVELAAAEAARERPEVRAWDAERAALAARAEELRRARIPNPSLSLFARQDGYGERVYGAGLSLPIPLPSPVGQLHAGEIAELEAQGRQAEAEGARARARTGLELARIRASYRAHRAAVAGFDRALLERAERALDDSGREIGAGRLSVREALPAQQALIELLQAHLQELEAWCLASVELARALDLPLERGIP
jgi:cobalt-zinc-cadmium efflux system outer membrane protein